MTEQNKQISKGLYHTGGVIFAFILPVAGTVFAIIEVASLMGLKADDPVEIWQVSVLGATMVIAAFFFFLLSAYVWEWLFANMMLKKHTREELTKFYEKMTMIPEEHPWSHSAIVNWLCNSYRKMQNNIMNSIKTVGPK